MIGLAAQPGSTQFRTRGRIAFRVIHDADKAFLRRVYASTRDWEFRLTTWTEAEKDEFLTRQFDLQDLHFQRAFPGAVRRIVTLDGVDVGRLYLERQDTCLRVIELALLPHVRRRGIGTDILRSLMNEAHGGKVPVRLNVERTSPALRLYVRNGFRVAGQAGHHLALEWWPDVGPREI